MECDICGCEGAEYIILVEGAKLNACADCCDAGKVLRGPPKREFTQPEAKAKDELEVIEGYGKIISSARRKMGLGLDVLAERINEKHSFLDRVEREKTLPGEKLARKLEKELGITLLQRISEGGEVPEDRGPAKGITLGDVIEIEKRKKQ